eukprot:TRINITY_DN1670_c0_g1_i1.p1 TRINITY_DN1670_c0_g1~~TRINITY_DN1670_c0_g1_i1.p1  ORF type:complete len:303 (+),score=88.12 TRINITY_DN1670_c0_g1_i1:32-910(+)
MKITHIFTSTTNNTKQYAKEITTKFQSFSEEKITAKYINVIGCTKPDWSGLSTRELESIGEADVLSFGSLSWCSQVGPQLVKMFEYLRSLSENLVENKPCFGFVTMTQESGVSNGQINKFVQDMKGIYAGFFECCAPSNFIVMDEDAGFEWKWGIDSISNSLSEAEEVFNRIKNAQDCHYDGPFKPTRSFDSLDSFKEPIKVNLDICRLDGKCVRECPTGALKMGENDSTILHDIDSCILCLRCINCCPVGALDMKSTEGKQKYMFRSKVLGEGYTSKRSVATGEIVRQDTQ